MISSGGRMNAVEAGVSQLNAVNIRDVCDTKSPVQGGARSSVEDAWDATDLVVFAMDCMKGIVASECKVIHCIVARSRGLSVAPWNEDELTVAVESLVEDDPVLPSCYPVSHVASFNLRERFGAIISLAAAVTRGSRLRPVEIPVPVSVSSLTSVSVVLRRRLSPHSVVLPRLSVSVRVVRGKEVPVETISEFRVVCIVLDQLVEHPGAGCRADPLTTVNPTVDPHGRLVAATTLTNLHHDHVLALMGLPNDLLLTELKGLIKVVKPAVDVLQRMVAGPVHRVGAVGSLVG